MEHCRLSLDSLLLFLHLNMYLTPNNPNEERSTSHLQSVVCSSLYLHSIPHTHRSFGLGKSMLATQPYTLLEYFLMTAFNSEDTAAFSSRIALATGTISSSRYWAYLRSVGLHGFLPRVFLAMSTAADASSLGRKPRSL